MPNLVDTWDSFKAMTCLNYLLSFWRSFWSFYWVQDPFSLCIPVSEESIYLMQCAMQCMIVHEWNGWVFIFHLNSFYSLFLDLLLVLPVCFALRAYYASVLSSNKHFVLMTPYCIITFLCPGFEMLWFIDNAEQFFKKIQHGEIEVNLVCLLQLNRGVTNVQILNTEKVVIWQEDVKGEDAFQREDKNMINQTSRPVKNTWAKKSKES